MNLSASVVTQVEPEIAATVTATRKKRHYLFLPTAWSRGKFLQWLRKTHAWLGLWGAALGILFGFTGILLNHRAVLKIPAAKTEQTKIQVQLPNPRPQQLAEFTLWLRNFLQIPENCSTQTRQDLAKEVIWADTTITQPERWQVSFSSLQCSYSIEYWTGNSFATVSKFNPNVFAILNRFHMASGLGIGWVLLADSIAGSFILLSISGILLWTRLHGPRMLAAGLGTTALITAIIIGFVHS